MPKIIYGTAWKKERTADLVELALKTGFRGIDTACQPRHYDEASVGLGLKRAIASGIARSSIFVQTKFTAVNGQDPQNIPYDPKARLSDQVSQSFRASQRNLQTDIIDSVIVHGPFAAWRDMMEVWAALEDLVRKRMIQQIGISNCYDPSYFVRLYQEAEIKPAILQNRFYAESGYDIQLRRFCQEHQIVYQSFWTLTANPRILAHPSLVQIATNLECTTAQLFFKYLMTQGIQPLTGTTSALHMRQDLAADQIKLSAEHVQVISKLGPFV
jgi:diketogulonate reductase-like aldo/keto reductase